MKMTPGKRAIDKIYRRRDRYEIPEWQREGGLWSLEKKQQLIDSILRGWRLPKFYFFKVSDDPEEYEVVDGQQRLLTIYEFFENELELSTETGAEFGGVRYKKLKQVVADRFDDFEIDFDIIEEAEEDELRRFFQRLQEGLPLTSSERLNAVTSKLRDCARRFAKHELFKQKVAVKDKRYAHFDIAAKVLAVEIEGINTGLRYDDLKAIFESQSSFSERSAVAKRVLSALDYANRVFTSRSPVLANRTVVQSFLTLLCTVVETGRQAGHEADFLHFFEEFTRAFKSQVELGADATDLDYIRFQRSINQNVRTGARTRHEILLRKLLTLSPSLSDIFDPGIVAQSGLSGRIAELGDSIVSVVGEINGAYGAKHGVDLLKPTSRSATALAGLRVPIRDKAGYQKLVDDLYMIFHEGAGNRLGDQHPPSFRDVVDLRTDLDHDVDHGPAKKVRSKRRRLGEVFRRYSGGSTPATLAPEKFLAVQATLLEAVVRDLRGLRDAILEGKEFAIAGD